jgi:hypothetical protein
MPTGRTRAISRLAVAAVLLIAGAGSAWGQSPTPVEGTSIQPLPQPPPAPRVWLPVFQFRSGFWVNLVQFLYLQARIERGLPVVATGQSRPAAWAAADLSGLSPAEREAWQHAVGYFGRHFADYAQPYDSFLVRVDDRLSQMNGCAELTGKTDPDCDAGIDPTLGSILEQAAPVYRVHWWPEQRRADKQWMARATKLVQKYGGKPAEMLATEFNGSWPGSPIPIDVTLYAGPYGAYTTIDPLHITISSVDPRNQGPLALEVVFRESSHAVAWPAERVIIEECQRQTRAIPRELWHALAFYTTARIFQRAFADGWFHAAAGAPALFAESQRSYVAARRWQHYDEMLRLYWQPYLDGHTDMESAISQLVDAL